MNLLRLLVAGLLAAAGPLAAQAATTTGSGRIATENRSVADFKAIAFAGSIDVVVRQGAREGVQVQADDNLLPFVETVVERGTLRIAIKKGESFRTRHDIVVTVDVIRLESLAGSGSGDLTVGPLEAPSLAVSLSGSGDASFERLASNDFSLRIAGSSDVSAAGRASRFKVAIAGSGDVKAAELAADEVTISIAGSGDAKVTAEKSLDVSIAGSGDVEYGGNPRISRSVLGSGSISRR